MTSSSSPKNQIMLSKPTRPPLSANEESVLRTKVIACEVMRRELLAVFDKDTEFCFLEYGLHNDPLELRNRIQREVDASEGYDSIALGFGLCGRGTVGIRAGRTPLILPRVDDCISLFLGSRTAYAVERQREPGTYYLTSGWIEFGSDALKDFPRWVERYGERKAHKILEVTYRNYTRVAFITMGPEVSKEARNYTRKLAKMLGARSELIAGSSKLFNAFVEARTDPDFIVVAPGQEITPAMFDRVEENR